jgi:hypothetical protein
MHQQPSLLRLKTCKSRTSKLLVEIRECNLSALYIVTYKTLSNMIALILTTYTVGAVINSHVALLN